MNQYQAKLEAIKAKRLNHQDRLQSLLIFISLLCLSLMILPILGFSGAAIVYEKLLLTFPYVWMSYVSAAFCILFGISVLFLIFYSLSIGLNHLVRFLSGIKES